MGAKAPGTKLEMLGKASMASPATNDNPITKVRRTSSNRDVRICKPLTMMKVTVNSKAGKITDLGITAMDAANFGKNPSRRKMAPTANATLRLVTPVAADRPTAGVDVLSSDRAGQPGKGRRYTIGQDAARYCSHVRSHANWRR